jgi:hypothetical protein
MTKLNKQIERAQKYMTIMEKLLDVYPVEAIPKHKAGCDVLGILTKLVFVAEIELDDLKNEKAYREQRKQARRELKALSEDGCGSGSMLQT